MVVLSIPTVILEYVAPVIYAIDVRAGVMIDVLVGTVIDLALGIGFDALADVDANICVATNTI